mgnify:FL=1
MKRPTALIADDEPLLREQLAAELARQWPELEIVTQARHGREAVEAFDALAPDVAFLDVHMPGLNGVEVARAIGRRAAIVFVTAYDQYAVEAFRQGAVDYLVKPLDPARLADTVQRLRQRLLQPASDARVAELDTLLETLAGKLRAQAPQQAWLQWIKASVGPAVRLIPVDQIHYLKSDTKYTLVVWDGGEALIRKTIRELADALDPERFIQIHRAVIVNLHRVAQYTSGPGDGGEVQLVDRPERLPVSRSYVHLFKQM